MKWNLRSSPSNPTPVISIIVCILSFCLSCQKKTIQVEKSEKKLQGTEECIFYGYHPDSVDITCGVIKENEFLADILLAHGVDYSSIDAIAKASNGVFDVRNLRVGGTYTLVKPADSLAATHFIYQNSPYYFVSYNLEKLEVEVVKEDIEKRKKVATGSIDGSLWLTMDRLELPLELIAKMEKALAWSVDFYRIQPGDSFTVLYEEDVIHGEPVGVGDVIVAYYKNYENDYYSIWYEKGDYVGYYDECGRAMKSSFLKAPVEYTRISSRYNLRRFHPVLKRVKPHLGTDYAAPKGTPIRATADGVVIKRSFTRGNGNYVKIKHNDTYTTQYLHMSRFGPGIEVGVHVKQGQTIGYIGKTGLATGYHVCYRFWKNGKQVDPLKESLPAPEPLPANEMPDFFVYRDAVLQQVGSDVVPESTMVDSGGIPMAQSYSQQSAPSSKRKR